MDPTTYNTTWLRRHGLTVIFAVVYVFLSLLVVEQNRTIESQRQLIRSLFQDSLELSHIKAHNLETHRR